MRSIILLICIFLISCENSSEKLEEVFNISGSELEIIEIHTIKIVAQSNDETISSVSMPILDNIALKAVLVDPTGGIIQEVFVNWSVTGDFSSSDLSAQEGAASRYVSFTGNKTGAGFITGVITNVALIDQYNIKATTFSTGLVNVLPSITPDEISKINGDNQTGQVATTLAQTLRVRVYDVGSNPIAGVPVTFTSPTGGGVIVSVQPISTDATGYANCIVKVGGIAGTATTTFSATIATGTTSSVLFTADSTPGMPAKLSITQHPDGGNLGTPLNFQPIIEIHDNYGNLVPTAVNTITLATTTGAGSATGTINTNAITGIATYLDIIHDTFETGVQYTFTSPGLLSATSNSFDIGQIHNSAQCVTDGGGWLTTDGGCKDISSGMVWSAISAGTYNWHQAVWNQAAPGSTSPDVQDEGRTTDNDPGFSNMTDSNSQAYCHDLVESGYSDWLLPRESWFNTANASGAAAKFKQIDIDGIAYTSWLVTSSDYHVTNYYVYNNSTLVRSGGPYTNAYRVKCVRFPLATQLFISQQVDATQYDVNGVMKKNLGPNMAWEIQPVIQVRDATNSIRTIATNAVTVSLATGTGNLTGTLTVNAVNGLANFTNLQYDKAETITLRFTSPLLTQSISDPIIIYPTLPKADCFIVTGVWVSGDGGCKDSSSGIIYSSPSTNALSWYSAIWDATAPAAQPSDTYDNGKTNDYYGNYAGTEPDNAGFSYCHDLEESGYHDWYLPSYNELITFGGKDAHLNTRIQTAQYMWTSNTFPTTNTSATRVYLYAANGSTTSTNSVKTSAAYIHCIRRDAPDHLNITVQPDGGGNGFGAGVTWGTQPKVKIVDADNSPTFLKGITITATLIGGTGSLMNNGVEVSSVSLTTDEFGEVLFSNLSYNIFNETFSLQFSASSVNWQGTTVNLTTVNSNNIVLPEHYLPSYCLSESTGSWETQDGGCKDMQAGGLVWSYSMAPGTNWYDAVWDSNVPGSDPTDLNDGALEDDYDIGFAIPATNLASNSNVCHKLILNGYMDWRMPTYDDLNQLTAAGRNGKDFVNTLEEAGAFIWSSTPGNTDDNARMLRTGNWDWPHNTTGYSKTYASTKILCVRAP